jgi:hypothetical protein
MNTSPDVRFSMKKICIVFMGPEYKSWERTGILSNLRSNFDLEIVILNTRMETKETEFFQYGECLKVTKHIYSVNQMINRNKSKSFKSRLLRLYFGSINIKSVNLSNHKKLISLWVMTKNFLKYSSTHILQTVSFANFIGEIIYKILLKRFFREIRTIQKMEKNFIKKIESNILIFPSTGTEILIFELMELARLEEKKTLMVIENWDNLTSKTSFPFKPDYITVMGNNLKFQTNAIHGIPLDNIFPTGLPKFEKLTQDFLRTQKVAKLREKFNVLYLGYSLPYNEQNVVNSIYFKLLKSEHLKEFTLTYRPHPFRQERLFEEKIKIPKNRKFNLDNRMKNINLGQKVLPTINDNYIANLKQFDLIIATPTTMVLEIMLLGLPCLVDGGNDGVHKTSPFYTLQDYLHQDDLNLIPELKIAKSISEILYYIDDFVVNRKITSSYAIQNLIQSDSNFSQNLSLHLNTIL